MKFKVKKSTLLGEVNISGAKNSGLKLLTASILSSEEIILPKFPTKLLDVEVHLGMLEVLGKTVSVDDESGVAIKERDLIKSELVWDERSIRNTLLILGCLLTRTGAGKVPLPGGCKLGERKYDLHVDIFEAMGAKVWEEGDYLCAKSEGRLKGVDIFLPMRSTGATENAILCGTLAEGITTVWNPHIRPEILDLIDMLKKMGADISVYGQQKIEIRGVERLQGVKHQVIPDNMEALTWLIASVVTKGQVQINNFPFEHLEIPLIHLRESGVEYFRKDNALIVGPLEHFPVEISTGPYPGINSDMQPLFAIFGATTMGVSTIVDLRFPGRYGYAEELEKMGAESAVDKGMLKIKGGHPLTGAQVAALDLRAGICLLIAGLVAEGETVISNAWQILRGYENIADKLKSLGANIQILDETS